jgi:hypothetical protein
MSLLEELLQGFADTLSEKEKFEKDVDMLLDNYVYLVLENKRLLKEIKKLQKKNRKNKK